MLCLRFVLPLLLAAFVPNSASARSVGEFCAAAKAQLSRDPALSAAAAAAFPNARYTARNDACIYPFKMLRYGDADALIAIGGAPGEACHSCAADMSAYVMLHTPGSPRVVARFIKFASSGFFGNPGRVDAIQLAGHDAFAVESGSTFQGYAFGSVSFFVFEAGRLVELKPWLSLSADDSGALGDDPKATTVDGSWRVGPGRAGEVSIAYKIKAHGRERRAEATWIVVGNKLVLKSGSVPPEVAPAGGQ